MKKILLLLPTILFPYFLLFTMFCIFTGFLMEELFNNFFLYILIYMFFYFIFALVCNIIYISLSFKKKWDKKEVLKINMIIKIVQIPAYIAIFVLGLIFMLTLFTIGFSIFFVIYDCLAIFLTGIIGVSAIISLKGENQKITTFYFVNVFLQFIFCLDVISAIVVYASIDRVPFAVDKPLIDSNDVQKKRIAFIPCIVLGIGSLILTASLILSEIYYPEIDELSLTPVWYQIMLYGSLLVLFGGIITTFIFKNRSNTLKVELLIEAIAFIVGIVFMVVGIFGYDILAKIVFSTASGITFSSFCYAISTIIGFCIKGKSQNVIS